MQLPSSGPGYFGYYASSKRWGTPRLVYGIQRVARRMRSMRAPRLGCGDISLRNGGDIAGHNSHERGVDADFSTFRNDGREHNGNDRPRISWRSSRYSRTLTQAAFNFFVSEMSVLRIYFNDPNTRYTKAWPSHNSHFHVRIR